MVKAGENFTLNMEFLNTSKVKSIQNMKITLVVDEGSKETGGSVFTPVQSSNVFILISWNLVKLLKRNGDVYNTGCTGKNLCG